MADFYNEHPNLPRARLERTVVLHYPTAAAAHGVLTALESNPNVEFVEVNRAIRFIGVSGTVDPKTYGAIAGPPFDERITQKVGPNAVIPNDPFFAPPISNDPTMYQWGSYAMRLPDAWQHVRGHAKVLVIDIGAQADHPDLKAYGSEGIFSDAFIGGNYRDHLSFDYGPDSCTIASHVHGTHTAGIVAATPDNGKGVAGACWHCPLAVATFAGAVGGQGVMDEAARALTDATSKGIQLVTMSFGVPGGCPAPPGEDGSGAVCLALDNSRNRDIVHVAAAGNDLAEVELPGTHTDVVAAGALDTNLAHWTRVPLGCTGAGTVQSECGSNFSQDPNVRTLDFTTPGQHVLSTVEVGQSYGSTTVYDDGGCGDQYPDDSNDADGYGSCSGTSMSSPYSAGVLALLRTANPLLTRDQLRTLLISTASGAGSWDQLLGYGLPDAAAAVEQVVGTAGGGIVANRATPMFHLYSSSQETHMFTTSPQAAVAEIEGVGEFDADTAASPVSGYPALPGDTQPEPRATFHLFTSPQAPDGSSTNLVPLYRMSRDRFETRTFCGESPATSKRTWAYTTSEAELRTFHATSPNVIVDDGISYFLEGIEGYLYSPGATPPTGAQRLYRYFNRDMDDWLLLLETETPPAGYDDTITTEGGAPNGTLLGWVLPNVDTDGDGIIDAWENLLGTSANDADSDNDSCTDGEELLGYIKPEIWKPSDPLDGLCTSALLFADGFETGTTSAWSSTVP